MRTTRLTKIAMVIFLSMIFFLGVQKPVLAAGKNTTVKIPVEQRFEVNNFADADKTGSYVLIADQIQNPMPEGSNRRTFTWNMSGNSSTELIMNVGQAGEYHYKLYQATENKENYTYDSKTYDVTIEGFFDSNNELMAVTVVKNENGDKVSKVSFKNSYTGQTGKNQNPVPSSPRSKDIIHNGSPVKTGDDSPVAGYLFLFFGSVICLCGLLMEKQKNRKGDASLGNPSRLDLTVVGNYSISTTGEFIASGSSLTVGFSSSTGAITLTHNGVKTNMGTSFSLRRHSASGTNGIKISQARESNNPYPGDLTFKAVSSGSGYTLYTIANIYIENYLYGVLPYEMGNSTNIEALKAQAVAARTYTVRMMQNRASGLYDVKDTTSDQVYRGTPSGNANCVAAVDATKGIVLMYGSSYITTYYSASNGGQTEIDRSGGAYAYMKVKDDPFDYANPSSTVKKKTVYADLTSSMNSSGLISLLKTKAVSKLSSMGYSATQSNTTLQTSKT